MKNILWIILIIGLILIIGFVLFNFNTNNNNNSSYTTQKSSTQTNTTKEPKIIEKEISTFTTLIHSKDEERQNNINITVSSLNDTVVNASETFSFCDTVGKATSDKGYEKADVYVKGKLVKALGGGICQVSTTLYNAVLQVPELEVTERHEHSGNVPYIEDGKDAAVSYGSYDLKFINHLNNSIKIKAENNENEIIVKIVELEKE